MKFTANERRLLSRNPYVKTASALLGHSQTSTTLNIYAHAVQKSNVKALNLMAGLLENTEQ